jgi:hypothetical protein
MGGLPFGKNSATPPVSGGEPLGGIDGAGGCGTEAVRGSFAIRKFARGRSVHYARRGELSVREDWRFEGNPLTIRVEGNRLVSAESRNQELYDDFWAYTHTDENSDRVGEFAIGTNMELKDVIGETCRTRSILGSRFVRQLSAPGTGRRHWLPARRKEPAQCHGLCTLSLGYNNVMPGVACARY